MLLQMSKLILPNFFFSCTHNRGPDLNKDAAALEKAFVTPLLVVLFDVRDWNLNRDSDLFTRQTDFPAPPIRTVGFFFNKNSVSHNTVDNVDVFWNTFFLLLMGEFSVCKPSSWRRKFDIILTESAYAPNKQRQWLDTRRYKRDDHAIMSIMYRNTAIYVSINGYCGLNSQFVQKCAQQTGTIPNR